MLNRFSLSAVCAALLAASSAASAITVAELTGVVDPSSFEIRVNNTAINTANFGISVNGAAPVYAASFNEANVLLALATSAGISFVSKGGSNIPVITLDRDVSLGIFQRPNPLAAGTQIADFTFGAGLRFDPDPVINFPISVLNRTASAQSYSFIFPLVLSPLLTPANSPATEVKSSFIGTLRSNGVGQVSIAPIGAASSIVSTSVLQNFSPVSLGVDVGIAQTFAAGVDGTTYSYVGGFNPGPGPGPFKTGPVPVTSYTQMIQSTNFTLSAGDRATMVAFSEITPVPEPAALAMMSVGVGFLVWAKRRRLSVRA
jgi:hypothetical protein